MTSHLGPIREAGFVQTLSVLNLKLSKRHFFVVVVGFFLGQIAE